MTSCFALLATPLMARVLATPAEKEEEEEGEEGEEEEEEGGTDTAKVEGDATSDVDKDKLKILQFAMKSIDLGEVPLALEELHDIFSSTNNVHIHLQDNESEVWWDMFNEGM